MSLSIHTINARGHVMLEVMRDYFNLSPSQLRDEIRGMHQTVVAILRTKGVDYSKLRSALAPSTDRLEAGFLFDSCAIGSGCYGREVIKQVLSRLDKRTAQSVLCGDLSGNNQSLIVEILRESMVFRRAFRFRHSTGIFCVYINNLSDSVLKQLNEELGCYQAYLGFIPATFQSRAKTYLSTCMANAFIKYGSCVIMGHEDDRPNGDNVNILMYPFEEYGYRVLSLQSCFFGTFLSFKIERAVYKGFEVDTEISLNAISDLLVPLASLTVMVDKAKHTYLLTEKRGILEKAQITMLSTEELAALIQSKIEQNYIYNLSFLSEHSVMKFNLIVEVPRKDGGFPARLVAAMEYRPEEEVLRLITLH